MSDCIGFKQVLCHIQENGIIRRADNLYFIARLSDDIDYKDLPDYSPPTDALDAEREKVERLRDALETYGLHGVDCMAGQSRAGRPTEDGGYETLYGYGKNEKWYKRGEFPDCTCGLEEALTQLKPEGDKE